MIYCWKKKHVRLPLDTPAINVSIKTCDNVKLIHHSENRSIAKNSSGQATNTWSIITHNNQLVRLAFK